MRAGEQKQENLEAISETKPRERQPMLPNEVWFSDFLTTAGRMQVSRSNTDGWFRLTLGNYGRLQAGKQALIRRLHCGTTVPVEHGRIVPIHHHPNCIALSVNSCQFERDRMAGDGGKKH